jgi:3-Ketosteroid 9alpha-hydroxylase C-terminal domain
MDRTDVTEMAHFVYIHLGFPTYVKNVFEGHIASQYLRTVGPRTSTWATNRFEIEVDTTAANESWHAVGPIDVILPGKHDDDTHEDNGNVGGSWSKAPNFAADTDRAAAVREATQRDRDCYLTSGWCRCTAGSAMYRSASRNWGLATPRCSGTPTHLPGQRCCPTTPGWGHPGMTGEGRLALEPGPPAASPTIFAAVSSPQSGTYADLCRVCGQGRHDDRRAWEPPCGQAVGRTYRNVRDAGPD